MMRTMEAKQIRRIPVIDDNEHLVGMISLATSHKSCPTGPRARS
jgi:CBS-domain-containing membrane protein